jgi:hypothetical protein
MKNLCKEEPKNITLVLVNLVGGWVGGYFKTCSLSLEDSISHRVCQYVTTN